jgi:anti-anti-sigma factor
MHPAVEIVLDDRLGMRVAHIGGVLDVFTASVVGSRILTGIPTDATELVLELEDLEFIDSAGVSALLRLREHARSRALEVHVRLGATPNLNPTVIGVLHRVFVVDDDVIDLGDSDLDGRPDSRAPVGSGR